MKQDPNKWEDILRSHIEIRSIIKISLLSIYKSNVIFNKNTDRIEKNHIN